MTYVSLIIAAIATVVGIICYSLAIIKYRQQMKTITAVNKHNSNSSQKNIELSLLMSALLTFVTMIAAVIVMICLVLSSYDVTDFPVTDAWTIVNTLFSMVSPWTLLVCSKHLRQSLLADIRKKLGLSSSNMVHPIVINNH